MLNGILLRPATVIVAKAKSGTSGEAEGKTKIKVKRWFYG